MDDPTGRVAFLHKGCDVGVDNIPSSIATAPVACYPKRSMPCLSPYRAAYPPPPHDACEAPPLFFGVAEGHTDTSARAGVQTIDPADDTPFLLTWVMNYDDDDR